MRFSEFIRGGHACDAEGLEGFADTGPDEVAFGVYRCDSAVDAPVVCEAGGEFVGAPDIGGASQGV